MANDFLERLATLEVPAPPAEFDRRLHQRLNRWLLAQQLLDFALRALPCTLLRMVQALGALVWFTLTGRFADRR